MATSNSTTAKPNSTSDDVTPPQPDTSSEALRLTPPSAIYVHATGGKAWFRPHPQEGAVPGTCGVPSAPAGHVPGRPLPGRAVSAVDLARSMGDLERHVVQVLKDRIDLRDALQECVDLLEQAFDFAGNSFGDPPHDVVREAKKILRRTS